MKNDLKLLVVILGLGLFLRTFNLHISPPGFNADEAALGYNAYSLILTGKDEWGEGFPLVFKSFSDYKPGLYVYLAIPFVAVLGLTEFAVRLPSILLGTLSVLLIYLLAKEIYARKLYALTTAFLLAVSPWHLHYSRGAWETNIATFFILLGVYAFVRGFKQFSWFYLSATSFVLSMYTYQSPRALVPLLGILLVVNFWKKLWTKNVIGVIVLSTVLLIPLLFITINNKGLARFQGVSIFTDIGPGVRVNQNRGEHPDPGDLSAKLFHNRLSAYGLNFADHYLDHFTPAFLFTKGDPLGRNKVPEMGQLYLFEIITVLAGIYLLIIRRFTLAKVVFLWLLTAPIAASLTYQTPHALRANSMVIPLTLISGGGFGFLLDQVFKYRSYIKLPLFSLVVSIIIFFVTTYLHQYYVHLPQQYALEWEYGFSQMVPFVLENKDSYQKIVITDRYDQAYVLMLFYSRYSPLLYQQTAKPTGVDKYGFSTVTGFDKFEFRPIGKEELNTSKSTLFIGTELEMGNDHKPLKVINFPNGTPAFKAFGT